jgi:hypothetical protein
LTVAKFFFAKITSITDFIESTPQLTVGDVDDMFVPLVDGLMCSIEESEAVIDSLLEQVSLSPHTHGHLQSGSRKVK